MWRPSVPLEGDAAAAVAASTARVKTFSFLPLFALRYFSLLSAKSLHYFAGQQQMLQVLLNLSLFLLSYLCRRWPHKRMCKQIVKRRRFFLVDFVLGGEGGWIFLLPFPLTLQTFRQKWRERESEIDTAKSIIYSQIDTETLCARATSAPK